MWDFKYELIRENILNKEYPYGFVIDFAMNLIPLIPPKLVIDYSSNINIEYYEINLLN
jgi:hypothetical protein